jgi:hypothetical protein
MILKIEHTSVRHKTKYYEFSNNWIFNYDGELTDVDKTEPDGLIERAEELTDYMLDNIVKVGGYSSKSSAKRAIRSGILECNVHTCYLDYDRQQDVPTSPHDRYLEKMTYKEIFDKYCCGIHYTVDMSSNRVIRREICGKWSDIFYEFIVELYDYEDHPDAPSYKFGDVVEFIKPILGCKTGVVILKCEDTNLYEVVVESAGCINGTKIPYKLLYDGNEVHQTNIAKLIRHDEDYARQAVGRYYFVYKEEVREKFGIPEIETPQNPREFD